MVIAFDYWENILFLCFHHYSYLFLSSNLFTEDDDDDDEDDVGPSTGIVQSPAASAPQTVQAVATNTVEESAAAADYPGKLSNYKSKTHWKFVLITFALT